MTMKQRSIEEMITEDLGYCCSHMFFRLFSRSWQAALRLGVSTRAIRKAKEKARTEGCPGRKCCMCDKFVALDRAIKLRHQDDAPV